MILSTSSTLVPGHGFAVRAHVYTSLLHYCTMIHMLFDCLKATAKLLLSSLCLKPSPSSVKHSTPTVLRPDRSVTCAPLQVQKSECHPNLDISITTSKLLHALCKSAQPKISTQPTICISCTIALKWINKLRRRPSPRDTDYDGLSW